MNRICVATRGIECWRSRLADPKKQWVRECSAFEAAVSWELAAKSDSGLPDLIAEMLTRADYGNPKLLFGVAEHQVPLQGRGHDSQCDFWALLTTNRGTVSCSVEAKANEAFGNGHQSLNDWLEGGTSRNSKSNRIQRWQYVQEMLPGDSDYGNVAFQLLHRCATAVIEAKRFGLSHAVFIVQAFASPDTSYNEFVKLCSALRVQSKKGQLHKSKVGEITLGLAWLDFPFASDDELLSLAPPRRQRPTA